MASGSNAPFSGEFVDLENVPNLPEGISAEQILEQNADAIRQAAEARHAAGLSQVEADGGFFDAFVDSSKISSTNSVQIKDFSGSLATVTSSTTSRSTDNDRFNSSSGEAHGLEFKTNSSLSGIKVKISSNTGNVSRVALTDSNQNLITDKTGSFSNGDVVTLNADLSSNSSFFVGVKDGGNSYDVGRDSNASFPVSGTDIDITAGANGFLGGGFSTFSDISLTIVDITALKLASSGTVTEKQFTFTDTQGNSFSPSKVGIFAEQTLNGQSISYDLKDSSGTLVKTFNQSDLNQLQSVNTTDDTFQIEANFTGGSKTPELEFLDVRGV